MIVRLLEGIGCALSATLVCSITASLCNDSNLNMMIGYMELSFSIGLFIGPLFGSFLYYLGGYSLPFIICGCLNYLCLPFIPYIKISEDKYESPGFLGIIFNLVNILFKLQKNFNIKRTYLPQYSQLS
jgi:MFS family permease